MLFTGREDLIYEHLSSDLLQKMSVLFIKNKTNKKTDKQNSEYGLLSFGL